MKRFLTLAVLCLFGTPAAADTFRVSDGVFEIIGDYAAAGGFINGNLFVTFSSSVNPGSYDPLNGPFFGYQVTVRADNAQFQACSFSQVQSMCGRELQNFGTFNTADFDNQGFTFLYIYSSIETTNMTVSDMDIEIGLPAGFTIAPVPETSTWLMMIIGFIAIAFAGSARSIMVPSLARR